MAEYHLDLDEFLSKMLPLNLDQHFCVKLQSKFEWRDEFQMILDPG